MNYSKHILIGRLGHDPSLKVLPSGENVCNFSVATSDKWKGKDGTQHEETTWYNIQVFGVVAEHCKKYLSKGAGVYIEGKLKVRPYNAKNGENRVSLDVSCSQIRFLGSKADNGQISSDSDSQQNAQAAEESGPSQNADIDPNDIPF